MSGNLFNNNSVDRPLIAFAFLAQAGNASGDLLSGLAPIFKPIAKSRVGQRFDPSEFAKEVAKLYALDIHPWAAEDLAPRLERAGLLCRHDVTANGTVHEYHYAEINGEFNDVTESDIQVIVKQFIEFATPILTDHNEKVDEKALENGLFDQLIKMDFWAVLRKPDRTKEDQLTSKTIRIKKSPEEVAKELQINEHARIDVLCASFILHLYRQQPKLYELLVKIASGAMVAEAVLNFQNPENAENLSKLRVILDSPLVMSLLNLTSEESNEYTLRICNTLKERGAQLATFTHSVQELTDNLNAVITLHDQGKGFGPTARRMASASFKEFASAVRRDPGAALAEIDVKVVTPLSSEHAYQYFSGDEEDKFRITLGEYANPTAQRRDAASIAAIVRLRSGKRIRMTRFYNADNIFVTENQWIPPRAETFLKARNLAANGDVPVSITDKYLAGLLLVMFGGKAEDFTRSRLLAHCSAALEARSDVMAKMQRFLEGIGEAEGERFRALMTRERAGQHLMQLTLGDSVFVTDANASKILEDVESILLERHRTESEARIEKIRQEHEKKISEAQARLDEVAAAREQDIARSAQSVSELEDQIRSSDAAALLERERARVATRNEFEAKQRLHQKEAAERESIRQRVVDAVRLSKNIENTACLLLGLVAAGICGFLTYQGTIAVSFAGRAFISSCVAILTFVCFWKLPDMIFGRYLINIRNWVFNWRLETLHVGTVDLDKCVIDWTKGTVSIDANQSSQLNAN